MDQEMNEFAQRMQQRRINDEKIFANAHAQIKGAVTGKTLEDALGGADVVAESALARILAFYHCSPVSIPDGIEGVEARLDFALKPTGIMRRNVMLTPGWRKDALGAFLGVRKDTGDVVALLPGRGGYRFHDAASGKDIKVNRQNEGLFLEEALCFYKPLPQERLDRSDLLRFFMHTLPRRTAISVGICALAATLVSALIPVLTNVLMGSVVETKDVGLFISVATFLIAASLSSTFITAMRTLISAQLNQEGLAAIQSALYMRVLSLPISFFHQYGAGNLTYRIQAVDRVWNALSSVAFGAGISAITSIVYILQLYAIGGLLVLPAFLIMATIAALTVAMIVVGGLYNKKVMKESADRSTFELEMLSGVQKIKLSGSERRIFGKWADHFSRVLRINYRQPFLVKYGSALVAFVSAIGTMILYWGAAKSGISVSELYAFLTAYGLASGAFVSLSGVAGSISEAHSSFELLRPILEAVPEVSGGRYASAHIQGGVELSHVSFRYAENAPYILNDLSLKVDPGEYVAIVGKTGCGKSTLIRLLLGFEKPERGGVLYDGRDIGGFDPSSLRQSIGVVMQNAQLLQGDVFSSIVISHPQATMQDAWEAAEAACIADDIRAMPMGMQTLVASGAGGLSGGQRQRLAIARAIVGKPKLLIFDEATSALDNISQRKISEALDGMGCTRIVIAHRLSTIKQCDRVVVLDQGRIVADGTYQQIYPKYLS